MSKKKLYLWISDYSLNTGEGNLARIFLKYLNEKNEYSINISGNKKIFKYLSPFYGILFCWKLFLKKKTVGYINYLPMWNFLIFLLLPPKTIIGPITGGANYSNSIGLNFLVRSLIFPIFYKISELIILIRFKNIIFSTDLLKKYLFRKTIIKSKFNFVLKFFKIKKNKQKKIYDFLVYHRKHSNKISSFPYKLIEKLSKLDLKINVIGDKLKLRNIKNFGYIGNKQVKILQSKSKFTFASSENIYNLFTLECLANNVRIFVEKKYLNEIKFYKKSFIIVNYDNFNKFKKLIKNKYFK